MKLINVRMQRKILFFGIQTGLITLFTFYIYHKLWRSYFVQDEWYYFSLFHQYVSDPLGFIKIFFDQFTNIGVWGIHITPLWNSLFFLQYQLFGLTYQYWAISAIFLHIASALSVSSFIHALTGSRKLGLFTGLFFTISSTHTEAVTWANTNVQTQIPVILVCWGLISWISWIRYSSAKYLILAVISFTLAVLIRENIFGLFFVLPIISFLLTDKQKLKQSVLITFVFCSIYALFRIGYVHLLVTSQNMAGDSLPDGLYDISYPFRLAFYSIKTIVHQILGSDIIRYLAEIFTQLNYPSSYGADRNISGPEYTAFIHSAGSDIVIILMSVPLISGIFLLWYYYRKIKQTKSANTILFSCIFIIASLAAWVLLIPFLLERMPSVTYVPSRQLYFSSIGTGLLVAMVLQFFLDGRKKFSGLKKHISILCMVLSVFWFMVETIRARHVVADQAISIGEQRRIITDYMKAVYPTIPDKTVFYITSSTPYFGFPVNTVPFQTNFGATILELYRKDKSYAESFYQRNHFIDKGPLGQGYLNDARHGFGYYYDGKRLLNDMDEHGLSPQEVIAFHYEGSNRIFQVTTDDIRTRIEKERKYINITSDWQTFGKEEYPLWFLVPPGIVPRVNVSDEKTVFTFPSRKRSESRYSVSIFRDTGLIQTDEFIEKYRYMMNSDPNVTRSDATIYSNNLQAIRGIMIRGVNSETFIFRHPTSYLITAITVDNSVPEGPYVNDMFYWCMRVN